MKQLKVTPIKNGTVIDHINSGSSLKVLKVLNLPEPKKSDAITVTMNARGKNGLKDIVKIENRELKQKEVNKIAVISPNATINIIRDYNVIKKTKVQPPKELIGIINCSNPTCITNTREPVESRFIKVQDDPLRIRCYYCDRELDDLSEHMC